MAEDEVSSTSQKRTMPAGTDAGDQPGCSTDHRLHSPPAHLPPEKRFVPFILSLDLSAVR